MHWFWQIVADMLSKTLYFLISPNKPFCTTWQNRKPYIASFRLNVMLLAHVHTRRWKDIQIIAWSQQFSCDYILTRRTTLRLQNDRCTDQTGFRKGVVYSILPPVTYMFDVNQLCHGVGRCVVNVILHQRWSESQWTIYLGYLEQMLAAIKHDADDNFVFRQDGAPMHSCACNTVQLRLLQREILNFNIQGIVFIGAPCTL